MSAVDMNAKMQLVPELRSEYASYPMERAKWLSAGDKAPDGNRAFIASPKPEKGETKELKPDYVWGPGTYGFGYYHLLTKESYVILSARLQSEPSQGCSCFGSSTKDTPKQEDLNDVYLVMYYRSKSPVPNDRMAKEHCLKEAGMAFRPADDLGVFDVKPSVIKK